MKRECKVGNSCGKSCIAQNKACSVDFSPRVSEFLEEWASGNPPTGIAAYFTSDYPDMNRWLYDPSSREELGPDIGFKVSALQDELAMLPPPDYSELVARYSSKGVHYDGKHFFRGMDFQDPDRLNQWLDGHIVGDTIEYPAFTSTTVANPDLDGGKLDGGWANKNIQIQIIHKPNGSTSARHMDPFKKRKDEGEMLYPPGQRFRVVSKEVLVEQERLPSRFREPLLNIFGSQDDGLGIPNLPLKAIAGDKPLSALMTDSEYSWFRDLLKKRGLPPVESWNDNTTLGDVYSKAKLKGGKVSLYNLSETPLRSQVKPEEATGIMDPKKVRIVLEEV